MAWTWKGFWGDDPVYRFNCGRQDFFQVYFVKKDQKSTRSEVLKFKYSISMHSKYILLYVLQIKIKLDLKYSKPKTGKKVVQAGQKVVKPKKIIFSEKFQQDLQGTTTPWLEMQNLS